jgi:iron complex outermembrane recepter protein
MRAAVAATAVCLSIIGLAKADNSVAAIRKPTNIPAEELAVALRLLEQDRNLEVIFVGEDVRNLRTRGATGDLTLDEALKRILAGTGLTYHYLDDRTISVLPLHNRSSVSLHSEAAGAGEADEGPAKESSNVQEVRKKSFWERFRLADADQATSATPASVSQENDKTSAQEEAEVKLEEITVTATRRSESVEKVPISIAALSQNDLAESGIKGITDIAALTPGLQLTAPVGIVPTITTISIRGLNTDTGASVVGLYLDDTPIQGRLSALGNVGNPYPVVFDLNRVEVERGPQGTLFGAGSEAGTVRFITNQPSLTEFSGFTHAEAATTQYGAASYEVGAAAGGPILQDELGFRVSVWDRHDGGYVDRTDPVTGEIVDRNANSDDKLALKAALAFQANEDVRITPSFFYQLTSVGDTSQFYGILSDPSTGHFDNGELVPSSVIDHFVVPSMKAEAHLAFADLTSTTSYMYRNLNATFDDGPNLGAGGAGPDGAAGYGSPLGPEIPTSPADAGPSYTGQTVHAFTQEVRLASNQPRAFLSWVAGIFYDHRTQRDYQITYSLAIDPTGANIFDVHQLTTDGQIAAYAQGDLHFTDKWTLTLGERVAKVKTDQLNSNGTGLFNGGEQPLTHAPTLRETPSTPRVALSYQVNPNNLLYASVSKGFRVGGSNAPLPNFCDTVAPGTYKSDYVWSYEVGAKNTLFDGKMQIDSSIFRINWSQIQQLIGLQCSLSYTTNAGSAVSKGFDLALQALATDRLAINLDVGYVDAYFTSSVFNTVGAPLVLEGDKIGFLPQVNSPWDVNVSANYKIPLAQNDALRLHADYQYHSHNPGPFATQVRTSPVYVPLEVADPATHLFDARLGYTLDKLDVALFVDNVFNSEPLLAEFSASSIAKLRTYSTFRPRTVGVAANLKF